MLCKRNLNDFTFFYHRTMLTGANLPTYRLYDLLVRNMFII